MDHVISTNAQEWLLVIDMQPAFGHPDSPWYVPDYEACAENVSALVDAFADRVLFTRFVPPSVPHGAWRAYYDAHSFACDRRNEALWDLDARWAGRRSVASPRFSKWRDADAALPNDATVVLCGVSTECCVLGTALEANDDGRPLRLVTDACAAATPQLHEAALTILADRSELLQLSNTRRECTRSAAQ